MSTHNIETFDQQKFVAEIRAFMKKHKISTRAFAAITGTSLVTLPRFERGEHGMTIKTAQKFIKAMKTYKAPSALR